MARRATARRWIGLSVLACALAAGCSSGPFASNRTIAGPGGLSAGAPAAVPGPPVVQVPGAAPIFAPATPPGFAPPAAAPCGPKKGHHCVFPTRPRAAPGNVVLPPEPMVISPPGVSITPSRIVAPIGSEVVLVAGICGPDGYLLTHKRIDWSLEAGSIGQLVAPSRRSLWEQFSTWDGAPTRIDNTLAYSTTSTRYLTLTRGTPTPVDDVQVLAGQAYVSVTSHRSGTSHVTALAPSVEQWDRRRQTAAIHWIDAQWQFPPPAINPAGTRHVLTTTVTRASDGGPVSGWIVRYQILDGPPAEFAGGAASIEVLTDPLGQASVELAQRVRNPGSNTIRIEVIAPLELGADRVVVGSGTTVKTWSAPALSIRTSGPAHATIGSTATFALDVVNGGDQPARGVIVTAAVPPALEFLNASVQPTSTTPLTWPLGDLGIGESRRIEINFRPRQSASIQFCGEVRSSQGAAAARDCITTTILPAQALEVDVRPERDAPVSLGQRVTFRIRITNRGDTPAAGVTAIARFEAGLEHATEQSPAHRLVGDIGPGETKEFGITLQATQIGRLPLTLEVRPSVGPAVTAKGFVDVQPAQPAAQAELDVRVTVPEGAAAVGQVRNFQVTLTNVGQAPLTSIVIRIDYPTSLLPTHADLFRFEQTERGRLLVGRVERLDPNQQVVGIVQFRCERPDREACVAANATTAEQLVRSGRECIAIAAAEAAGPGKSDLALSVASTANPVRLGTDFAYVVTVRNQGTAADHDVVVEIELPPEVTLDATRIRAPVAHSVVGGRVRFAAVVRIEPGEELVAYRIPVRAARPGEAAARATVTSRSMPQGRPAAQSVQVLP